MDLDSLDDSAATIERILGRRLEDNPAKFASLNDLPSELVEDARRLPGVLKFSFLMRFVDIAQRFDVQHFVEDVVQGRDDPLTWKLGRVLFPTFAADELLVRDVLAILTVLDPGQVDHWQRFPPERLAWERGMAYAGAPAVVQPSLDYRWNEPAHVGSFLLSGAGTLESVANIEVATRRWVASRIAMALPRDAGPVKDGDPRDVLATVFPRIDDITEDAVIAVEALLEEERLMADNRSDVPGFRGPDAWYAGQLDGHRIWSRN